MSPQTMDQGPPVRRSHSKTTGSSLEPELTPYLVRRLAHAAGRHQLWLWMREDRTATQSHRHLWNTSGHKYTDRATSNKNRCRGDAGELRPPRTPTYVCKDIGRATLATVSHCRNPLNQFPEPPMPQKTTITYSYLLSLSA